MTEYHKIQTVYLRDPENQHKTLLHGQWSRPEFEYLKDLDWVWTEKVDGTNTRVSFFPASSADTEYAPPTVRFGGKTDNAQIPTPLLDTLQDMFPAEKLAFFDHEVTLYGEGYGAKIQSGGKYLDHPDFVLFDVRIGGIWLERKNVTDIAKKLGIEAVPEVGMGPLEAAVDYCSGGPLSSWGSFEAEGLVMRPATELMDRQGRRIITKVKTKDFGWVKLSRSAHIG